MWNPRVSLFNIALWLLVATTSSCSSGSKRLTFTTVPPASATAGSSYSYQAAVSGSTLTPTYLLVVAPSGMTVNSTGLVSWSTTAADVGAHNVTLSATAGRRSGRLNFTVTVNAAAPLTNPDLGDDENRIFVHWRDSIVASGEIPDALTTAIEVRGADEPKTLVLGWVLEDGTADLGSRFDPRWASWQNPETQSDLLGLLEVLVQTLELDTIEIEAGSDRHFSRAGERDAWVRLVFETTAFVASQSPGTTFRVRSR